LLNLSFQSQLRMQLLQFQLTSMTHKGNQQKMRELFLDLMY